LSIRSDFKSRFIYNLIFYTEGNKVSLKEKIVSKFSTLINFKLFIIVGVGVSLIMYALMLFFPVPEGKESGVVGAFNYAMGTLYIPAAIAFVISKFQKQLILMVGGGSKTIHSTDGYVYHVDQEVPENMTLRESERNLRIGWFLGLMAIIYYYIAAIGFSLFTDDSVKAAKKAGKKAAMTNGEIVLIVIGVIVAIVVFFGAAALMARLIEKKKLKKEFYAIFTGILASSVFVNFGAIVGWLFSTGK